MRERMDCVPSGNRTWMDWEVDFVLILVDWSNSPWQYSMVHTIRYMYVPHFWLRSSYCRMRSSQKNHSTLFRHPQPVMLKCITTGDEGELALVTSWTLPTKYSHLVTRCRVCRPCSYSGALSTQLSRTSRVHKRSVQWVNWSLHFQHSISLTPSSHWLRCPSSLVSWSGRVLGLHVLRWSVCWNSIQWS